MRSLRALERQLLRSATSDAEAAVAARLRGYAHRPTEYVRDCLRRGLTPKQVEIFEKLAKPPYRVLARSANSQGKTFVAAAKVSHFFDTQRPSITLATAPTFVQVRDLLFKELRTLRGNDPYFAPKDTRLQRAPDDFVHGFTAAKADSFQGRHGVALGIVFDEATGIDPKFWSRGETMFESTGGHWWLACYNPNDSASPAYIAEQTGTWANVTLSALEHPNVLAELAGEEPPFPAAIRLNTVLRRMASECQETRSPNPATDFEFPTGSGVFWHPTTPDFEAQILGRWPASPTSALFSPVGLEFARTTPRDINPDWLIAVGCDVARFGDDKTAICVRIGPCVLRLETHAALNTTQIAELLRRVVQETLAALYPADVVDALARQVPVFVDDTGGYGAGVIDQSNGYNFIGVNNSAAPPNGNDKYATTRSYVWCELAAIVAANALDLSRLPAAEYRALADELTAARFRLDSAGRRSVEGKAAIKERLRRSPDRADAVTLAFYGATSE